MKTTSVAKLAPIVSTMRAPTKSKLAKLDGNFVLNANVWARLQTAFEEIRAKRLGLEQGNALRLEAFHATCPAGQRKFTKHTSVLTEAYIATLRQDNLTKRKAREPYFVQIAELYQRIGTLEVLSQEKRG
jgi:hypothetical protein